jgi:osmotically-inducible protein OsmY
MDDQTIELKIYDALERQLPPGNRISTTSYNGAVLLTGEVVSEAMRQQAEQIARNLSQPPVREVYNELVIGPPSPLSR